jgi:hypothetical protein
MFLANDALALHVMPFAGLIEVVRGESRDEWRIVQRARGFDGESYVLADGTELSLRHEWGYGEWIAGGRLVATLRELPYVRLE